MFVVTVALSKFLGILIVVFSKFVGFGGLFGFSVFCSVLIVALRRILRVGMSVGVYMGLGKSERLTIFLMLSVVCVVIVGVFGVTFMVSVCSFVEFFVTGGGAGVGMLVLGICGDVRDADVDDGVVVSIESKFTMARPKEVVTFIGFGDCLKY